MTRTFRILALVALLMSVPLIALASEPLPGDSCTAGEENNFQRSGGPEIPTGHFIVCKSGTWRSILSWDAAAAITKIGNLTCANGQVLKFNGTTWACAADDAGSGGITALTGDVTASGSGSVTATIAANAVTSAKIADGTIANADLAGSIALSKLAVTGTANSSVFLRGDGTWAAPPSGADNLGNHTATTDLLMGGNQVDFSEATGDKALWYSNTYGTGIESSTLTNWSGGNHRWRVGGTSVSSGTEEMLLNGSSLNIMDNSIVSNAGTVIDANGGWHRTYGATGWYNGTYGGGWHMSDTTWLRAYGGKAIYTTNVARADAGIYTNQICNISGTGCVAQSALGGGGGGVPAGTMCGMATTTYYGVSECTNSAPSNAYYQSRFTCNGVNVVTTCPSGYTRTTYPSGARPCGDGDECLNCSRTCVKN